MSFIGLFLKSIFIMVLMIAVFLIGIISFLYLRVKRMTKQFRNGTNSNANRTNTRRQQQNTTSGSTKTPLRRIRRRRGSRRRALRRALTASG